MSEQKWPSWRYGPKGEADIFQSEVDVPKGWVDHPSKIKAPTKAKAEVPDDEDL